MNKKTYRKSLALLLVAALVVTSFPSYVFGNTATKDAAPQATPVEVQKIAPDLPEGYLLGEVPQERERSIKHFLKDDGTYEAVVYPNPVHYQENGVWQDIDNRLVESDSFDKTGEKVYKNKKNEFSVEFSKSASSTKTLLISKGDYRLEWGLESTAQSVITVNPFDAKAFDTQLLCEITGKKDSKMTADSLTGKDAVTYSNEKIKTLSNLMSSVTYSRVLPSVDLEYVVQSNEVKENLILQNPTDISTFNFNLNLKQLTPILQKDGSIWFVDPTKDQEPVFVMQAPYMYDAKGEISSDVIIGLQETTSGFVVTVTPDSKWLKDETRAYPVTIDPPITTSIQRTDIYDAHVAQTYPNANYQNSFIIKSGYGASSHINRSFMKFTLPTLSSGSMITDAKMVLYSYTSVVDPRQVDVHKVSTDWSSATVTWNNQPAYSSTIEDYQIVVGSSGSPWSFEITSIAKDWYTGGANYGVMIRNLNETTGYMDYLSSDCSDTYAAYRPQVILYYINNSGLEGYWSYHSQDVGRAGIGYVNDYNGNLVFAHTDISMSGSRLPITVQHVYNSNDKSTDIGYGKGWRTNFDQRILLENVGGTNYYAYIDEDGTKHYFYWDSGDSIYKDENGLNITLKINADNTFTVKDKGGNSLGFTTSGYLATITDSNGNAITISYSGTKIETITDPVGRVVDFVWTNGLLTGINDPSLRQTAYTYDTSNMLTTITYPDTNQSIYTYNTDNTMATAKNFDGYKVAYAYTTGSVKRVATATESHTDGTLGDAVTFTYGSNISTLTDTKGKNTTYQFNDWGNTVNTADSLGYANYSKYNETSGSDSKNRVTMSSKLQRTVASYLINHNMETTTAWVAGSWDSNGANGSYSTTEKYSGAKSYKLVKSTYGSRHLFSQTLNLTKGNTYTLSGYIKTSGITNTSGYGALLFAHYYDANGAVQTVESESITGTTGWQRVSITFTVPSNATSDLVYLRGGIAIETGTAYFDCLQLEDGSVANRYNIVENGDFRGGSIAGWEQSANNESGDQLTTVTGPTNVPIDSYAYKFEGNAGKHKFIRQIINQAGAGGDTFVVSGWGKGESVPLTSGTDRRFGLLLGFVHSDGSTYYVEPNMNADASEWQYSSYIAKSDAAYTSVIIYCTYYDNTNTAYFDGIRIYKEEFGDSYTYDSKGNLVSAVDLAKQTSGFQYNTANDLTKATDPKGKEFNYAYDTNHNVTSATTPTNVVYSFTYDSYGNPLTSKIGCTSNANLYIGSAATYTDSNNYLGTLTDPSGNTITNDWNPTKGVLDSMTDGRGKTTSYAYSPTTDQLTQTAKTVGGTAATVDYAYQNDKLNSITRNSFSYVFAYDSLGNNTTVKAGTQTLLTNTFEARTSLLTSTAYANGQTINYVYDETNRVTQRKAGEAVRFTYEYDASGNLGFHRDLQNPNSVREYRFVYDVADRLISVAENNGNLLTYTYDSNNNTNKITDRAGGTTYTTNYAVDDDNRPTDTTWTIGSTPRKQTLAYDLLGRTSGKTLTFGKNNIRTTSYSYLAGQNGSSTAKVGTVTDAGVDTTYTYDPNGNIATITKGGQTITYFYDELNQMIRENNQVQNLTITYSYDIGGNLTEKKTYAFTTADPIAQTPTSTIPYIYGDTNWKDKLTSFNGNAITYDNVGNPLTYAGYTYTWEDGRQMAGISGNSKTISYSYNDQGIRQSKTVNGITTNYRLVGDRVSWEGNGTDSIYYTYDGTGNLVSMNLNGTEYFYTRNLQGDVIGLIDSTGSQVVSYSYDSWGNVLSITGTLASTLGQKNPYRYRGYRQDSETGMYYLNSRYYVPEWGRMLNADTEQTLNATLDDLVDKNLYAYCDNNPISRVDMQGSFWQAALLLAGEGAAESMLLAGGVANIWNPVGWALLAIGTIAVITTVAKIKSTTTYAEHTKLSGSKKRTNDKHTKPRPGRSSEKKKQSGKKWSNNSNKRYNK